MKVWTKRKYFCWPKKPSSAIVLLIQQQVENVPFLVFLQKNANRARCSMSREFEWGPTLTDKQCKKKKKKKRNSMSDELRSCPFCGMSPVTPYKDDSLFSCPNCTCPVGAKYVTLEKWNTRPVEDTLRAELNDIKTELSILKACDVDKAIIGARELAMYYEMKNFRAELADKDEEINSLRADIANCEAELISKDEEIKALDELVEATQEFYWAVNHIAESEWADKRDNAEAKLAEIRKEK